MYGRSDGLREILVLIVARLDSGKFPLPSLAIPYSFARLPLPAARRQDAVTTAIWPLAPLCSICDKPVELETSKTDHDGLAVHEECYFQKLKNALDGKRPTHP